MSIHVVGMHSKFGSPWLVVPLGYSIVMFGVGRPTTVLRKHRGNKMTCNGAFENVTAHSGLKWGIVTVAYNPYALYIVL